MSDLFTLPSSFQNKINSRSLVRLEDNALLVGAIASFMAVAAVMYFTRSIDWYSSIPSMGAPDQPAPEEIPANPSGVI